MKIPRPTDSTKPLKDPREAPDFRAQFYPTANGKPAPPLGAQERHDRIVLEFLAAYYLINQSHERLQNIRAQAPSEERQLQERAALQDLEVTLRNRDALEDLYVPSGIIAEPVMKEGSAVDVRFTFGDVTSAGQRRNLSRFSSAYITIAVPKLGKVKGRKPTRKR